MSKPKAIEWNLNYWQIQYAVGRFDVGDDVGPVPANWQAKIEWYVDEYIELPPRVETRAFKTFKEAREWIERETGNKYEGFSYDHQ